MISLCMYFAIKYTFLFSFFRYAVIIIEPTIIDLLASCFLRENKYIIIYAWLDRLLASTHVRTYMHTHAHTHYFAATKSMYNSFWSYIYYTIITNIDYIWINLTRHIFNASTCTVANIKSRLLWFTNAENHT